jgi:hypothetical protein
MPNDDPPILVLVRDLLFSSKIAATASAAGAKIQLLRDPQQLTAQPGVKLIVDLNQPAALDAAAQWKLTSGGRVIGFVSHVDSATIDRARELGIDQILPRSQFVTLLPDLLK